MAGATLNDCLDFEIWLLAEQEYWRQRGANVPDQLINHRSQRGEMAQSQDYTRRWLVLEALIGLVSRRGGWLSDLEFFKSRCDFNGLNRRLQETAST